MMLEIARETLAGHATIGGMTAEMGASVITYPAALPLAAIEEERMAESLAGRSFQPAGSSLAFTIDDQRR